MTNRRQIRLDKYGISKRRYLELLNFCMQYGEWKKELEKNSTEEFLNAVKISGIPYSRTNVTGDPTGDLAVRRAELHSRCEMVEQTAIESHPDDYQFLIWNVTQEGASYDFMYEYAKVHDDQLPVCTRKEFYQIRRLFFFLIDKKR